jgi:hypothetical protein
MTLKRILQNSILLIVVGISALVRVDPASRPVTRRIGAPMQQHVPIVVRERRNSVTSSTNWSGYAVTGAQNSVTDVKGSWTVPAVFGCSSSGQPDQYSSFWIGIDGYNSNTVEQIGTESDCIGGVPTYYVWYEFYPHWGYLVDMGAPIYPGDTISAEVNADSSGLFTLTLKDLTAGKQFITSTKMKNARRTSAEWIAEAPWSGGVLPLANFDTANFGSQYTGVASTSSATIGSRTGSIGSFGSPTGPSSPVQKITMVTSSGATKAQPSDLSTNGSSFSIQWVSAGP